MTYGDIYKLLPSVYTSWFDVKLAPLLRQTSGNQRSFREAKTLTQLMDILLKADILQALMVCLGRLQAVTDVSTVEGTSWQLVSHHEIVTSDAVGLITQRSRANQAADQRELLRTQGSVRGAGQAAHS